MAENFDLLKKYIKEHIKIGSALFLFFAIFFVTFILFKLPLKAVLYPTSLCLFLGFVFIVLDFFRVKRKHKQLFEIKRLTAAMISSMPDIKSIDDEDYQAIILSLKNEIADLETVTSTRYYDTVEYYTVWVHQIKTPIASMRLTLQNEDTPLSRKLSSNLFRIEQYVEMVLAFLRMDSSSSDYVFKELNVDDIIKQAIAKFAHEFIDRKIQLLYEPIDKSVITDEKWLSFVIEQVLSNALKYTSKGSIKIYMRKAKTLCIEDTGIGIAPEDLPRIFEKGYTGYNGRTDKKASGIGLYLCKQICKNLGAKISAESEIDKGTTVCIDLEQYNVKLE